MKLDRHNSYEAWIDKNKGRFAVGSNGIYDFDSKPGHYNDWTAFGWVDRSAHTALFGQDSYGAFYYDLATEKYANDFEKDLGYSRTASLIKSAQQASAGFIKFFFDSVDIPTSYTNETQTNQEEITPPPTRFTSFNRVTSSIKSVTPVVNNVKAQYDPAIYGNIVVWRDLRNGNIDYDIYMKDLSTGIESPVATSPTTSPPIRLYPAIYGNIVVWQCYKMDDSFNNDIYMKDISTGIETAVTTNSNYQSNPAIYGNIVVWQGGYYDIYMKDISTGIESPVTTAPGYQRGPAIYGNKVVWQDYRNYYTTGIDIYMKDLSTGIESSVTTAPGNQSGPAIYGNKVVWTDGRNGNDDIYMKDLTTGIETAVTANSSYQSSPAIYGNIVVWRDRRNGNDDIYMAELQ